MGRKVSRIFFLSTIIIYDTAGRPRLLAAGEYTASIIAFGSELRAITSEQYERAINGRKQKTMVNVFVQNKADLDIYLPYLNRWLQANLLGGNVDCTKHNMPEACEFAEQVIVSTRAYLLTNKHKSQPIPVPKVKAADIPFKIFIQ